MALTPPACSAFISLGTRSAQIFMYAAGCVLRTFSIAAAPCFLKSAASASRKSLLNDLRVASKEPPGFPRFKVWPTNRDRPAFNAIMGANPPIDYNAVGHRGERMVEAHRFFSEQAREWLLLNGPEAAQSRGAALETVVRDLLQMVVIDLAADENAQEIFETLNA